MSEIPSEFFNKKSFRSLPRLAFLTWLFVFVIDAVLLQRLPYDFTRVAWVWIIGFSISFLFELARYKNLDAIEKKDYKKYFMLLNAFIIFLYASSYTGLTKQIGAWGELKENTSSERGANQLKEEQKAGFFLAAVEWAIPVLAKQTSYFPDVTAIAENKELKEENARLRNNEPVISTDVTPQPNNNLDSLQKVISDMSTLIGSVTDSLRRINDQQNQQIQVLLQRINSFNSRQSDWSSKFGTVNNNNIRLEEIMYGMTKDKNWFPFFFTTPIDNSLPAVK